MLRRYEGDQNLETNPDALRTYEGVPVVDRSIPSLAYVKVCLEGAIKFWL